MISAALLGLLGCIAESGDKACGKNQVSFDGDGLFYCRCAPGYFREETTCKACGQNETSDGSTCSCKPGFARGAEGVCVESALGAPCSDDTQCAGEANACVTQGASGYCTSSCTTSSDCERGYLCATGLCKKAPTGYLDACMAPADCKGEATYCESFQTKTCQVTCSKSSPCPGDWSCCDIALAGVVLCVEPAGLTDGMCPAGGKLVTP